MQVSYSKYNKLISNKLSKNVVYLVIDTNYTGEESYANQTFKKTQI